MRAVDAYLDNIPEVHRELGHYLRELIISLVPGIEERYSYKLPVYHYFGMFAFLSYCPEGMILTFMRGKDLVLAFPQLRQKGRAIAASVVISTMKDIDTLDVIRMIESAADWNREAKKQKIPMVRSRSKK